jgi:Neuraminidase (sialidase)
MSRFLLLSIAFLALPVFAAPPLPANKALALQEVISFDAVSDNKVLHALLAGRNTGQKTISIRYLKSTDGGAHWSKAVELTNDSQTIATRGNDIQLAVAGNKLVAIWQRKGELPNMGAMVSYYSHDAGKTWQLGANPAADNNGDQSHLDIIADKKGIFHTVWLADPEENGYQSLRYARSLDGGAHWQAPVKLDDSTCSCCWNTLALSATGELNILYRDMKPRDMALMQSADNGVTWQHTSTVGSFNWQFDGCPHIGGGLAISDNKVLNASVWTGLDNKAGLYTLHSTDNGKTWSEPQAIGKLASHSDMAVNQQNAAIIWDEREPDGMSIFTAQSKDSGKTWGEAQRLSTTGNMATHPRILATKQGFVSMWTEKQAKQPSQWIIKQ